MTKTITVLRSYGSAANLSGVLQRLPAIIIALWLGVISISMIPKLNVIEGGILFILFFISCLLIDSLFNPKRLKSPKVANAIQAIGLKNYIFLIGIHISVTILLAAHISIILLKGQILVIIIFGLVLNVINSKYIINTKSLANTPDVTGVFGGIVLPMIGAFYIVGNEFDIFTIAIIGGIALIYSGLEVFNQTREDIEIGTRSDKNNSIEWEALTVAHELGVPNTQVKEIAVQLYNIHNEKEFNKIPSEHIILFLPHCLRVADRCKGVYNEEGLHCKHCTKDCKINQITRVAQKLGYRYFVVPGGAMVFNIAKKYQPQGVIAVACYNELREGSSRTESEYKVPFQVIPLCKDGCVNTDVCVEDVVQVLSRSDYNTKENN